MENNIQEGFMIYLFNSYEERKKKKRLYSKTDYIPQNLIEMYYQDENHLEFNEIISNFKRKYINNENKLENVHAKEEQEGLSVVYDYIKNKENININNIYVILKIHSLLYSKVPCPEFGGSFRNVSACIANSDVKTTPAEYITKEVSELYGGYDRLLKFGDKINQTENYKYLITYINECIELKTRLIEIHPFLDGNGRTCRALVNLLFRRVGLPPVYVKNSEKNEYLSAMDKAIREKDSSNIKKFYYYKICDSIYELDIKERIKDLDKKEEFVKKI